VLRGTDLLYRTRPVTAGALQAAGAEPGRFESGGAPEPGTAEPGAVALLYGASQAAARTALARLGIAASTARMRPASGADLLVGTGRAWATDSPGLAARPVAPTSPTTRAGRDAR